MKKFRNKWPKIGMIVVAVMICIIPNMKVYSAVGSYEAQSMALEATTVYSPTEAAASESLWPAVLAAAAGVGLAIVFAVGVIDGWNSIDAQVEYLHALEQIQNPNDFSQFDN
jgi:hypothetical protein